MKEILITKGLKTQVDDDVYDELSKFKWYETSGYAMIDMRHSYKTHKLHGKIIPIHRMIMWLKGFDLKPTEHIDHINRDKLDNRFENLRICDPRENSFNIPKKHKNTTSNYKGIYRNKNTWYIQIKVNKKSNHVGVVYDEVLAAKLYDALARYYFREFAFTNFEKEFYKPMSIEETKTLIKQIKNVTQS